MGIVDRVTKRLRYAIIGQNSSGVDMSKLISVTEAANQTGFSRAYFKKLLSNGRLKGQKVGHFWAIDSDDLDKFMSKPRKKGRPSIDK